MFLTLPGVTSKLAVYGLAGLLLFSAGATMTFLHDQRAINALKATYAANLQAANAQAATQTVMNKTVADVYNQNFKDTKNAIQTKTADTVSKLATRTITIRVPVESSSCSKLSSDSNPQGPSTTSTAELSPAVSAALVNLDAEDAINAQMHDDLVQALIKQGAKVEQ